MIDGRLSFYFAHNLSMFAAQGRTQDFGFVLEGCGN
jgi:hypothetical protein